MLPEEYSNELNEEDLWAEIEESYPYIKTSLGTMVGRFKARAYNKGFQEGFKIGVSKGFIKGWDEGEQHQILKIVIKRIIKKYGAISFDDYISRIKEFYKSNWQLHRMRAITDRPYDKSLIRYIYEKLRKFKDFELEIVHEKIDCFLEMEELRKFFGFCKEDVRNEEEN